MWLCLAIFLKPPVFVGGGCLKKSHAYQLLFITKRLSAVLVICPLASIPTLHLLFLPSISRCLVRVVKRGLESPFFFNFQLSHLFPQLGCHQFGRCASRSGISGALPAGIKWLNQRYARAAHGVFSGHAWPRSGQKAQYASIPFAPPQRCCWAFFASAAKGSKAARALGLSCLFFSGALAKNSKVASAMRGRWLRVAHVYLFRAAARYFSALRARMLRIRNRVELGGAVRSILRFTLKSPAPFAIKPIAYPAKMRIAIFIFTGSAFWQHRL